MGRKPDFTESARNGDVTTPKDGDSAQPRRPWRKPSLTVLLDEETAVGKVGGGTDGASPQPS